MIDTEVEGSPTTIRTAATFLDQTLRTAVSDAGDDAAAARRKARYSWAGRSGDEYGHIARECVAAADDSADRLRKGGDKLRACAGQLERMTERLGERRSRAIAGGLTVTGTVIAAPPAAVSPGARPPADATPQEVEGWEQRDAAHAVAVDRIRLYDELADEVTRDWERFDTWMESSLTPFVAELQGQSQASVLKDLLSKSPAAFTGFAIDLHARTLAQYAKEARTEGTRLRNQADEARRARRSGNPARRAAGRGVDVPGNRAAARGLDAAAEGAERIARRLPIIGTVLTLGFAGAEIAGGASPSSVIAGEAGGVVGGVLGGAAVVGGAALLGVGAPVIAVAAGAAIVGV
ncbi:MAG: hypothetical protein LT071_08275, partial [Nocardioides sp.]|nr:hypothetical protein [Nocardioides sp.]